jgi:hypothetical protein
MSGTLSDLVYRQPVNGGIPITNLGVHGDLLRIVGALKLAIDLVLVLPRLAARVQASSSRPSWRASHWQS